MSRAEERRSIAADLAQTPSERGYKQSASQYIRWCAANAVTPFASADEAPRQLVRFLHANQAQSGWAASTCTMHALGIATEYMERGNPDPRGSVVRAWLRAKARAQGGKAAIPLSDALSKEQVLVATTTAQSADTDSAEIVRLRGIVAVAEAFEVDPTLGPFLQRLRRSAFQVRTRDIVVRDEQGRRHILDRQRQPVFVAALETALAAPHTGDFPLRDPSQSDEGMGRRLDSARLRRAFRRAHPRTWTRVATSTSLWRDAAAASTPEDRAWWIKCIDPGYEVRLQDVVYLLVGVLSANRHATLERLTLGHILRSPQGFEYVVRTHEHKGGLLAQDRKSRDVLKRVDHLPDHHAPNGLVCPACALAEHFELRHRRGGTAMDPLFASTTGKKLGLQAATTRLRNLVEPAMSVDSAQVIGTRSLRVTAATLARQAGMTPLQIAYDITDHRDARTAEIYIRRVDPFSFDLVIGLQDPASGESGDEVQQLA